jgi:hypothetical protein
MRRALITTAFLLAAILALTPSALAKRSSDGGPKTEHGVNRDKLVAEAKTVVEERNGITVSKIASCGPTKKHGRPNFSKWLCGWRASGLYPGQVPYACAGKAVWKRKSDSWRVDPCKNQRQPEAPLLDSPNPPPVFGFNDNWIFAPTQALNMLEDTGATVARMSLSWRGVEGDQGKFNWYGSDQIYQHLLDRGIEPLWVLIDAPCWAQADPRACANGKGTLHPDVAHYDDFVDYAVAAAKRYPQSVGFEVWNEPNYPLYWGGPPEPNDYAKMLKMTATALHEQVPGATVVSAGLSPHSDNDTSGAIGFRDFLISMYENGAAQEADAIGIHPYPGVGPDEDYVADVRVYLGKIQNVLQRYNATSTPLWATEFGVSTTGDTAFTEDQQAKALTNLYDLFRHVSGIQLAIVHRFIENPSLGGREGGFGVVSANLVPKPAYCALIVARDVSPPPAC